MTPETKRVVLSALSQYRGDDYERASHAFRGLTPTQMQEQHGASGQTRQEILDGYREHVKAVEAAVAEVLPPSQRLEATSRPARPTDSEVGKALGSATESSSSVPTPEAGARQP